MNWPELLTQSSADGILAYDNDYIMRFWNPGMEELTGSTAEKVLGGQAFELFPFLKEIGEDKYMEASLRGETTFSFFRPFNIPELGRSGYFEARYSPVRNASGEIVGGMGITRDVTERFHKEASDRFRTLVERTPFAIQLFSLDGDCVYANPAWERLWLSRREDLVGYNTLNDPHVDSDQLRELFERAFRGEAVTLPDTLYDPAKNGKVGRPRWIRHSFFPVVGDTGKLIEIASVTEDVTDTKALELSEQLSLLERQKFETLFARSPVIMALFRGPDLIIEKTNFAYQELIGHREVTGKPLLEAIPEMKAQPFIDLMKHVYKTGEPHHSTETLVSMQRQPGAPLEEAYLDFSYQRIEWPDGRPFGIYGTAVNVTQQVHARHRVEKLAEDLRKAVQARDNFLLIASHELRTPVTSLKIQNQTMQRSIANSDPSSYSPERINKLIARTTREIDWLVKLIENMLDVSRLQTGRLSLDLERCELVPLVHDVCDRFEPELRNSGMEVRFEIECHPVGQWDRLRLDQVVTNLITNAIRYAPGRPLNICIDQKERRAVLTVKDQGEGIASEHHAMIFQRFVRLDSKNMVSGMGLGLYIVQEIVHAHGGSIRVESSPDLGAAFVVELPLSLPEQI